MQLRVKQFNPSEWPLRAAELIQDEVDTLLNKQGRCSVMLTGGRSAERLYNSWADLPAFQQLTGVCFYFGDERCVPPDHLESNYGMALRGLFQQGIPFGCSVSRMETDDSDWEAAAQRYEELLPENIDILLLGVGEDGHIASLFPGSVLLDEVGRHVVPIVGPKPPYERFTITPPVIAKARSVFVLATGEAKALVFEKAQNAESDFRSIPACLVLNGIWLLDTPIDSNR